MPPTEPRLGIFWLLHGKLLIDSVPLSECEQYGDHLNYPGSHIDVWERWRRLGKAPVESEYEEYARGRVMCQTKTNKFTLLADRLPSLTVANLFLELDRRWATPISGEGRQTGERWYGKPEVGSDCRPRRRGLRGGLQRRYPQPGMARKPHDRGGKGEHSKRGQRS